MGSSKARKRFVVCIDGTWYDGNGQDGHGTSNNSNCFRIYASVQRGLVRDKDNNEFDQNAKYFAGIGVEKSPLDKFNDGLTGVGCSDQVEAVYNECLKQAPNEDDEIWLFGFSRGAYVARVVAALLHKVALKEPPSGSRISLKKVKSIDGDKRKSGLEFITRIENGRLPPKVMFLGLFDTVKMTAAESDVDITKIDLETQIRHVLALNEERALFPILHVEPSLICGDASRCVQAWFVGAHADMGGGTARDGLSLYPLQWMLIESQNLGLVFKYDPPRHVAKNLIQDPLKLAFPEPLPAIPNGADDQAHTDGGPPTLKPWTFRYSNGLVITMFDLRSSHKHKNLQQVDRRHTKLQKKLATEEAAHHIYINYGPFGTWKLGPRKIFATDTLGTLLRYCPTTQGGTVIHPSVYFLLDTYATLGIGRSLRSLQRTHMEPWKDTHLTYLCDDTPVPFDPWLRDVLLKDSVGSCRILICGNTGVGKSTLLNHVFGDQDLSPVSANAKGTHDIKKSFEDDHHPGIIIHDSEGFQAGAKDEVVALRAFLKHRTRNSEPREDVDAIWLCIEANSSRPVQRATSLMLKAVAEIASHIPIVVVGTKMDEFKNNFRANEGPEMLSKKESTWLGQFATESETSNFWSRLDTRFAFVSKCDEDSIKALVQTTVASLGDGAAKEGMVAKGLDVDLKIEQAVDQTMRLLRTAVSTASIGLTGVVSSPSISRHLCETIAQGCFGLPKAMMKQLTSVLDNVVWRNLGPFMLQSVSQATVIWGGVAALTFASGVGGIPLALGASLLEAPAAARIVVKCACDLILILERSYKDGGRYVTKEKIQAVASIYMKDEVSIEIDGREERMLRRKAVHRAVNDLFPKMSLLAWRKIRKKSVSNERLAIEQIIEKYRFERKVLDDSASDDDGAGTDSAGASIDLPEDREDIEEFLEKTK